jgi:cysteine desulfurase / selenocysteine lyase
MRSSSRRGPRVGAFPPREAAYFDHASIGPVPTTVRETVDEVLHSLGQGTLGFQHADHLAARASKLIADEWGVLESQVELMSNAGEALNAAARALALGPGSTVLVERDDFPQSILPFRALSSVRVAEVKRELGTDRTQSLIRQLRPETAVVSVTHVHAETGETIDLEQLAAACREVHALLVVDGSQAAGAMSINASLADIYVATGYKWQLAGFGVAAVARSEQFDSQSVGGPRGYNNVVRGLATGHTNLCGAAALAAAGLLRREHGLAKTYAEIESRRRSIATSMMGLGLTNLLEGAGILSIGASNPEKVVATLRGQGVVVAARGGRVRISPSFMTLDSEQETLIGSVEAYLTKFGVLKGSFND